MNSIYKEGILVCCGKVNDKKKKKTLKKISREQLAQHGKPVRNQQIPQQNPAISEISGDG